MLYCLCAFAYVLPGVIQLPTATHLLLGFSLLLKGQLKGHLLPQVGNDCCKTLKFMGLLL